MKLASVLGAILIWLAGAEQALAYDSQLLSKVEDPLILGTQGNAAPSACAISADGEVIAFLSTATNLVAGDNNGRADVFVDTPTNLFRISRDLSGAELPMASSGFAISQNGQFVAFRVDTGEPVLGSAEWGKIYRLNRNNGTLIEIADRDSTVGNLDLGMLAISANGRYIAFLTTESILGADTDGVDTDVYRYDVQTGNFALASIDLGSPSANGDVFDLRMDASGSIIAFSSNESDLVAGDSNGRVDVFVRDFGAATTTRVSVSSNGTQANNHSYLEDVSADGLHVAFRSSASNLDSSLADNNNVVDVFRHSRGTGATRRVSRFDNVTEFNSESTQAALSEDGRLVWFISRQDSSVPRLWRKDMQTLALDLIVDSAGGVANVDLDDVGDDACVTGGTFSLDLTAGDVNARGEIFRVHAAGATVSVTREGEPNTAVSADVGAERARLRSVDRAGRLAVIEMACPQADTESFAALPTCSRRSYLQDRFSGQLEALCRNAQGEDSNGSCDNGFLSGDGRYAFFESNGTNVHPDVTSATSSLNQLYRRDLQTASVDLITRDLNGDPAVNGAGSNDNGMAASDDGSRVAFLSYASTLVTGDTNQLPDIFLWTAGTGIVRISVANNGTQASNEPPYLAPFMSANGRYVVFAHGDDALIPGDSNGEVDILQYDVDADSLTRIAQPPSQSSTLSSIKAFSADGERLALFSAAPEFSDPDNENLFLWRRASATVTRVAFPPSPDFKIIEPIAFLSEDDDGMVFGLDVDPDSFYVSPELWRQYLGGMDPILSVPPEPNFDVTPFEIEKILVADDQSAFFVGNWPLASGDDNAEYDVGVLQSGFGYIEFTGTSINVDEGAGSVQVSIRRRDGQAFAVNAKAVPQNGSAINGSDYVAAVSGISASWSNGESGIKQLNIAIIDDISAEASESFTLELENLDPAQVGNVGEITIHILDNDSSDLIFANGFD